MLCINDALYGSWQERERIAMEAEHAKQDEAAAAQRKKEAAAALMRSVRSSLCLPAQRSPQAATLDIMNNLLMP